MTKEKKVTAADRLDSMIGFFSPSAAYDRMRHRRAMEVVRSYEGNKTGRRTKNWSTSNQEVNDIIKGGISRLRSRSRDLVRNNPWIENGVLNVIPSMTIGDGIIPKVMVGPGGKRSAQNIEAAWAEWGETVQCDADGNLDFYGLQALVMKTIAEAGSVLVRRRRRRFEDGLAVPLQLQILEPEYLCKTKDSFTYGNKGDGNRILNGIEFDSRGRRLAYHLYKEHPQGSFSNLETVRVPAEDVQHIYRVDRPGQVDGVPWTAPLIIRMRDLDDYEDAQLIRQKIAACFAAFVHDTDELEDEATDSTREKELERMEPGIIQHLGPGKDVRFGDPPTVSGYDEHTSSILRSAAAGLGITYEALTNDYSKSTFSSARMGHIVMYANIGRWRWHMIVPKFCRGSWGWFNEAAVLAGVAKGPVRSTWVPPRREFIDPVKETNAVVTQVKSGLKSLPQAVGELGHDYKQLIDEQAEALEYLDKKGVKVDTDLRGGVVSDDATISSPDSADDEDEVSGGKAES